MLGVFLCHYRHCVDTSHTVNPHLFCKCVVGAFIQAVPASACTCQQGKRTLRRTF